jgi:hypothetical protein
LENTPAFTYMRRNDPEKNTDPRGEEIIGILKIIFILHHMPRYY